MEVWLNIFLASALDESEWSTSHSSCFTPGTHWMNPRIGLDTVMEKKLVPSRNQTLVRLLVAHHYMTELTWLIC
jgi:hypothetical protein